MFRITRHTTLLAAILVSPSFCQAFERNAWLADFEQLKSAISENYPNLEWAAERGMDLPALEQRARDGLSAAKSDAEARATLDRFVFNFGDGHLSLSWPSRESPSSVDPSPTSLCAKLGYQATADLRAIVRDLPAYQAVGAGWIGAGIVTVDNKRLAVLRIPLFNPSLAMCEAALRELSKVAPAACDEECTNEIGKRADNILLDEVEDSLRALAGQKPAALLVDVAGNGGGNDTAIAVARMLGGDDVLTPSMGFVRNAERADDLLEDAAALESALQGAKGADAVFLTPLVAVVRNASQQAMKRCDLAPLWSGKTVDCTNLIRGPFFAGGLTARPLPDTFRGKPWADQVTSTAHHRYTAGIWRKPIVVLVDGNSASATELFAAMLQDSRRAMVIGAPTVGAGCGWTLPKHAIELKHSRGSILMPDCARFRRDGRNELDGVEPDDLIAFRRYDSVKQRASRLAAKLPGVVLRMGTTR